MGKKGSPFGLCCISCTITGMKDAAAKIAWGKLFPLRILAYLDFAAAAVPGKK